VLALADVCDVLRYEPISLNSELSMELSVLSMELMFCILLSVAGGELISTACYGSYRHRTGPRTSRIVK